MNTLFGDVILGGELPGTAVYKHRAWSWEPHDGPEYAGRLSITLQRGKRATAKVERDEYLVECLPPPPFFAGRAFALTNVTDPAAEEVYTVHVGDRPGEWACTCKAGQYRAPSDKHADALRAAIEAGAFGPPPEARERPARRGPWVQRVS